MKIIILGAGQVGGSLAENLAKEDNDITLIDLDETRLRQLKHRMDIQTIQGVGSHPAVLIQAGIEQADMLIAVTNSDEVNMLACHIAGTLFKTPTKIARIRATPYYEYPSLLAQSHMAIDVCISPEELITSHIENLIHYPGASQVIQFSTKAVMMLTIKVFESSSMIGQTLTELTNSLGDIDAKALSILRLQKALDPHERNLIEANDHILFISHPKSVELILIALQRYTHPNRRIMIAGGGHIGTKLAKTLEHNYRIKVIDKNEAQAHVLASELHKATVLQGNIADSELLVNENIEFTDLFCAVTNDDETNIMACLQAKRLGARHTMALVNRNAYVELIDDSSIDHAISPQHITIGSILAKLRRGHMLKVQRLQHADAEVIELIALGDEHHSDVVGKTISDIDLPKGALIVAIVRHNEMIMAAPNVVINALDHVIILLLKKRYVRQVEKRFQSSLDTGH
jgi:trk system potassium uptake protein TrkA